MILASISIMSLLLQQNCWGKLTLDTELRHGPSKGYHLYILCDLSF